MTDYKEKLKNLLRELFQFDSADLDFGIYAILNRRRAQIERFIEEDLLNILQEALALESAEQQALAEERLSGARDQLLRNVGQDALDAHGFVVDLYKQLPLFNIPAIRDAVTAYEMAKEAYQMNQLTADTEAQIYNDLYRFFARYYDNGDFVAQRRFGSDKYALPYSGQEVYLYWANAGQYYIKSGEYFTDYTFTLPPTLGDQGAKVVFFKLHRAETDRDNIKSDDRRFFVLHPEQPYHWAETERSLTLNFEYRPLTSIEKERVGNRDQQDKLNAEALVILSETLPDVYLKAQLTAPESETKDRPRLLCHLHRYTARNSRDYFIHQNLALFLHQELDYFLKNEVLNLDDIDLNNPLRARLALARVRTIRHIGQRVIAFLAQIENFQKRLFEKRKFVLQSNYCLTLDRIPDSVRAEIYAAVLKTPAQLQAWRDLYALDQATPDLFNPNGDLSGIDENFLNLHPHLMLDTVYLAPDLKARLLGAFDNLEAATDGLLIHGENFQALNLLLPRYSGQIKCIYIDPPYNTGNDNFIYKDNFRHSSWLALMDNRLRLAWELLVSDGVIFVSIDENELHNLRMMLDQVFEKENFIDCIVWQKRVSPANDAKWFSSDHDYIMVYTKSKNNWHLNRLSRSEEQKSYYKNPDNDPRGPWNSATYTGPKSKEERPNLYYPITNPNTGEVIWPKENAVWKYSKEAYQKHVEQDLIYWGVDGKARMPRLKKFLSKAGDVVPRSIWEYSEVGHTQEAMQEFLSLLPSKSFSTPKPTRLIKRILQIGTGQDSSILDFFAGSGTTAHAVINLNDEDGGNRKYVLVEIGDYFDTVLKPRLQKMVYSSKWKDGRPVGENGGQSHMFQYLRLESYEDALANIAFKDRDDPANQGLFAGLEKMPDYFLHYLLDFETEGSPTLLAPEKFGRPFDYRLKDQPQSVDLVSTFNLLLGLRLETQHEFIWDTGRVVRVMGHNPDGKRLCILWRNLPDLGQMEAERVWLQRHVLAGLEFDLLYVNGECALAKAQPLEPEFHRLMFATVNIAAPLEVTSR